MLKKLQHRFVLINMAIVTVILGLLLFMIGDIMYTTMERSGIDRMRGMFHAFENRPSNAPPGPRAPRIPFFSIETDESGNILEIAGDTEFYELTDTEFVDSIKNAALNSSKESALIREYHLRFLKQPVEGKGIRIVYTDVSEELTFLHRLYLILAGIGILSFFVFLFISYYLSKWAVRPAKEAWEEQKRFVGDASHELKTPLTVILTNSELLLSEEYTMEQKGVFARNLLLMAKQMQKLVEDLLSLTRTDHALKEAVLVPLDFSELCENALLPFEPLFFEQGLTLETEIAPEIKVKGSESHLTRLVEILLDNALKYTEKGGTVRLDLSKHRKHCLLKVSNPSAPLSEEDLTNIFKRFYRTDAARNDRNSYGLGLSIAEGIVSGHGGRIWAEWEDGRITLSAELPGE